MRKSAEKIHWRKIFSKDDVVEEKSIKAWTRDLMSNILKLISQSVFSFFNLLKRTFCWNLPDISIVLPTVVGVLGILAKGLSSTKCLVAGCMVIMKQLTTKSSAYLTYFCNIIVNSSIGVYSLLSNFSGKILFYISDQISAKISLLFENPFLVFLSFLLNFAFVIIATGSVLFENYF